LLDADLEIGIKCKRVFKSYKPVARKPEVAAEVALEGSIRSPERPNLQV